MMALVSASLLNCRIRTLPKIGSAIDFKRCLSACEEEEDPKKLRKKFILEKKDKSPMKEAEKFSSMWENPLCCEPECEPLRHDILFLKKTDRVYTRTWNECEDFGKEKYVCVGEILPPESEKRPRRKHTAKGGREPCTGDQFKLDLMVCNPPNNYEYPCPRLSLPGCKLAKVPPSCTKLAKVKCCQKRCTQYPAYSECDKPKPKVSRPIECNCLKIPSTCEVYAMFRKYAVK